MNKKWSLLLLLLFVLPLGAVEKDKTPPKTMGLVDRTDKFLDYSHWGAGPGPFLILASVTPGDPLALLYTPTPGLTVQVNWSKGSGKLRYGGRAPMESTGKTLEFLVHRGEDLLLIVTPDGKTVEAKTCEVSVELLEGSSSRGKLVRQFDLGPLDEPSFRPVLEKSLEIGKKDSACPLAFKIVNEMVSKDIFNGKETKKVFVTYRKKEGANCVLRADRPDGPVKNKFNIKDLKAKIEKRTLDSVGKSWGTTDQKVLTFLGDEKPSVYMISFIDRKTGTLDRILSFMAGLTMDTTFAYQKVGDYLIEMDQKQESFRFDGTLTNQGRLTKEFLGK